MALTRVPIQRQVFLRARLLAGIYNVRFMRERKQLVKSYANQPQESSSSFTA